MHTGSTPVQLYGTYRYVP